MISSPIPPTMRALVLEGTGFEHLQVKAVPTPRPGPQQLLGRVDAAGICTSLIKLIEQGPSHTYLYGWDITRFPIILGDEGCVTLAEVGSELAGRYRPGERYAIQPAVDIAPINHRERYRDGARGVQKLAVGYTLQGHLAEYILIGEEVIEAGCLLPLPDPTIPFAHAALAEPISCVISAQDHHIHLAQPDPLAPRQVIHGLKPGGIVVILGAGVMGRIHVDLAFRYKPKAVIVSDPIGERLEVTNRLFLEKACRMGVALIRHNPGESDLGAVVNQVSGGLGADDVIVAVGSARAIDSAQGLVGRGAVLDLFGGLKKGYDVVPMDTGIIHYRETNVTGSSGGSPWDVARTLELMASGEVEAGAHITRIGDLEHAPDFLEMIKAQSLDGKAVVYPHRRSADIFQVPTWSANDEQAYLAGSTDASVHR
ncbi:MAG: alcohol dehydrogenase catalytic domain-containing protein [Chloroflexota bacterium]